MHGALTQTHLGWAAIAWEDKTISALVLADTSEEAAEALTEKVGAWTAAPLPKALNDALTPSLGEAPSSFELKPRGTPWQQSVWAALRAIPAGQTRSYAELAGEVGKAKTHARAVALACGANPIAVWIPCHRVVRENGQLAGFRWGIARKRQLLEREALLASL